MNVTRHTPKGKLLELLKGAPDFEQLREQTQEELAIVFSERCVYGVLRQPISNGDMANARRIALNVWVYFRGYM